MCPCPRLTCFWRGVLFHGQTTPLACLYVPCPATPPTRGHSHSPCFLVLRANCVLRAACCELRAARLAAAAQKCVHFALLLQHVDTEQPMLKVDNCTFVGTHVRTMGKTLVVDAALRDAPGSSAEPVRAGSAAAAASTSAARSGEAAPHMEEDGTYVLPSGVVLRAATQHRIVFRLVEGRLEDLVTTA
ncbi:hypothetical protein EON67_10805 [archaeon]|nr:MAG: hypothetical protein EON67_10805 [archaeon]